MGTTSKVVPANNVMRYAPHAKAALSALHAPLAITCKIQPALDVLHAATKLTAKFQEYAWLVRQPLPPLLPLTLICLLFFWLFLSPSSEAYYYLLLFI